MSDTAQTIEDDQSLRAQPDSFVWRSQKTAPKWTTISSPTDLENPSSDWFSEDENGKKTFIGKYAEEPDPFIGPVVETGLLRVPRPVGDENPITSGYEVLVGNANVCWVEVKDGCTPANQIAIPTKISRNVGGKKRRIFIARMKGVGLGMAYENASGMLQFYSNAKEESEVYTDRFEILCSK